MKRNANGQFVTERPWLVCYDMSNTLLGGEFPTENAAYDFLHTTDIYLAIVRAHEKLGMSSSSARIEAYKAFTIGRDNT